MLTTTAVAIDSNRGLGGRRARLAAAALVAFLFVVIYAVAATGNARAADGPVSAPVPVVPGVSDASAGAAGADVPALSSLAPQSAPAPTDQTALTQQAANAAASAVQQQPQNIIISIRINSPGNDGPISQINASVGAAGSSNSSATGQSAGTGGGSGQQGGNQGASTSQAADSSAAAAQNQPQNMIISIRINSPGDNGPIVQQNIAVAVSSADNGSVTGQQQGAADGATATGTQTDPTQDGTQPAATPAAKGSTSSGKAAPPSAPDARSSASQPASGVSSSAGTWHSASAAPANPAFSPARVARHTFSAATHRLRRPVARTAHDIGAVPRNTADVLRNLASRPTVHASDSGPNVSNAVVLTLVAILGAFAVLFASSLMGRAPRVLERWTWRLR